MLKTKKLLIILMLLIVVLLIPNMVNAVARVESRNFPSNDGTIELNLTGLELSDTKQYEFALVAKGGTPAADYSWHLITNCTTETAKLVLSSGTSNIIDVLKVSDSGQIFIREKNEIEGENTEDVYVVNRLNVDLTLPYLQSLVYTKNNNGHYDIYGSNLYESIGNNWLYSEADHTYVQWQKVENTELIKKFLQIKNNNESLTQLESYLPICPTLNWSADRSPRYLEKNDGLYILWVKRTGDNCKEVYSCIIHDGLPNATTLEEYLGKVEATIPVNSVSLPSTKTVELGKTITLTPGFNPTTATNKIVTWKSSNETVATVNNAGKINPKKVGSTIITVTSQDGNKKATCTVTVTKSEIKDNQGVQQETNNKKKTFKNHTYQIINKLMSWQEAKEYCESLGGYLVTITSEEEQSFITSLVKEQEFNKNRFWMGATDKDKEGTWKWITGEKFSYKNWGSGQPNNNESGGQNFGVYVGKENQHRSYSEQWDDINEGAEDDIYFICEWGEVEKESTTNKPTTTDKPSTADKDTSKDTTTSKDKLPDTGKVLLFWIIGIVAVSGIVAHIRYKKLYM